MQNIFAKINLYKIYSYIFYKKCYTMFYKMFLHMND